MSKQDRETTEPARQTSRCGVCLRDVDELTGTVLAGHHQPLQVWVLCLYFLGVNLSNAQIAKALGLHPTDAQRMTEPLREGMVARHPEPELSGEVECDEVSLVAGHQGHPAAVRKKTSGASPPAERGAGTGHVGEGQAAGLWDAPARRCRGREDAGECQARDHPSPDPVLYCTGDAGAQRMNTTSITG